MGEFIGIRDQRATEEEKKTYGPRDYNIPHLIYRVEPAWENREFGKIRNDCYVNFREAVMFSPDAPIEHQGRITLQDSNRLLRLIHDSYDRSINTQGGPQDKLWTFTEDELTARLLAARQAGVQQAEQAAQRICDQRVEAAERAAVQEFRRRAAAEGNYDALIQLPVGQHTSTADDPLFRFDPPLPADPREILPES